MAGRTTVCSPIRLQTRTTWTCSPGSSDHAVVNVLAIAWLALGLVWAVGFGSRAAWVAGEHSRRRQPWFLFGAVLGPGALAILDAAPPGVCARCLSPVEGWSKTCVVLRRGCPREPDGRRDAGIGAATTRPARAPMAAARRGGGGPGTVADEARLPRSRHPSRPPSRTKPRGERGATAAEAPPRPAGVSPPRGPPQARRGPRQPGAGRERHRGATGEARPAIEPPAEHQPTYVVPPAAQPANAQPTPPAPSVADAGAVTKAATNPTSDQRGGGPQLDLDVRRPMRLASCVFVEGTEALVPGMWYQLTTEGEPP